MKIETKFNVGDTVYYFTGESVNKSKITDIEIFIKITDRIKILRNDSYRTNENTFIGYYLENTDVKKGKTIFILKKKQKEN